MSSTVVDVSGNYRMQRQSRSKSNHVAEISLSFPRSGNNEPRVNP